MRTAAIVTLLAMPAAWVTASAADYSSNAACRRANEPTAVCDKMFPLPPEKKIPPGPIEACTGIMDEATAQLRHAIVYLRYDSMNESHTSWKRAMDLHYSAVSCARTAQGTQAALGEWERAQADYEIQTRIFEAATQAR